MNREINIPAEKAMLEGAIDLPKGASGIVVFAHGSGSSRFSPRNVFVAEVLQKCGIATLLIDLLTEKEDRTYETRFDIDLLTKRLAAVVQWLGENIETKGLKVGLFGASTGAAAALNVAAKLPDSIAAVVSRGGRPDLSTEHIAAVTAPVLLIVGGNDFGVIELNEQALAALHCEKKLEIVPGATHLFEEAGALEEVAALAAGWFARHFIPAARIAERPDVPTEITGEETEIPSKFQNSADTPTRPPGKTSGAAKEGYRHFHRK